MRRQTYEGEPISFFEWQTAVYVNMADIYYYFTASMFEASLFEIL